METEADFKLSTDEFKLGLTLMTELNCVLPEAAESFEMDSGIESGDGSLSALSKGTLF